jgi:hypothetical protein
MLNALPEAHLLEHEEVMSFLEARHLYGRGIGWVDGRTTGFLNDRFPLADARSKPRCRLESCALARPTSRDRAQLSLSSSEIGQAAGTLFSDQCLKPQAHQ